MDLGVAVLGFGWLLAMGIWYTGSGMDVEMELRCIYFAVYRYQSTLNIFTLTSAMWCVQRDSGKSDLHQRTGTCDNSS